MAGKKVLKARNNSTWWMRALRNAVLPRGEEIYPNPEETGTIVETTVLRHLFAYNYRESGSTSCSDLSAFRSDADLFRMSGFFGPEDVEPLPGIAHC